jgi:hypothetical protein
LPGTVLTTTVLSNTWGAMSMPSLPFLISLRLQISFPFWGLSANASDAVAP